MDFFHRLRGANILTEMLLKKLNSSGRIHCVPASLRGIYVIRFTITSARTSEEDIHNDWKLIKATADTVLAGSKPRIKLADIKEQAPEFGSSLLLVNTPMTPKVGACFLLDSDGDRPLGSQCVCGAGSVLKFR